MASTSESSSRANIRIEIKNDFTEEMEVDTTAENAALSDEDIEDGEISDSKSIEEKQPKKNQWQDSDEGLFSKEKLQTRANRFGLNPSEITTLSDQQLEDLHNSLGITEDEEINIRFEAIHMYGTQDLNTQDVFDYFGKYGPSSIEWINDESCNVLWMDKLSTARAFLGLSKAVDGMPVSGKSDPFQEDEENPSKPGRSVLLRDRDVVLSDDGKEIKQKVHITDIDIPIPPGYWRLGEPHPKAKFLLLRFAKLTDKKPIKSEKFSEYYRKYGARGLISESKKKRMKGLLPEEKVPSGNPWGSIARNWNNDTREFIPEPEVPLKLKNVSKSILNRLGANKRPVSDPEEDPEPEVKKSKVPRMRMYADEEEARINKVKQLKKIRELEQIEEKMTKTVPDLRNRIGRHAGPPKVKVLPEPAKLRPVRIQVTKKAEEKRVSSEDEDDLQVQQRSKVTVIVKKPQLSKPTVASTIWSRLDLEKRKQLETKSKSSSESESSDSSSSDSDSDEDTYNSSDRQKFSKAVNSRPGFNRDLKSRLGLNTDHKSPLRIEINNDHYKK